MRAAMDLGLGFGYEFDDGEFDLAFELRRLLPEEMSLSRVHSRTNKQCVTELRVLFPVTVHIHNSAEVLTYMTPRNLLSIMVIYGVCGPSSLTFFSTIDAAL